jgi:uncharacterized protein (DUF4415 family)
MMKNNYDFSQGKRGAVTPITSEQTKLTILIDKDILEWFGQQVDQQGGGDYLVLINKALRNHIEENQQKAESIAVTKP